MKNERLLKFSKMGNKRPHNKQIKPRILPIETLEFCVDYFGQIKSRFDTDLTIPIQNRVAKTIRRLRSFGFLPFTIEEIVFDEFDEFDESPDCDESA